MNSNKEILACIDKENIKYLHSGQISKFVFPMERSKAHKEKIPHLIIRFFIMAINPKNENCIKYGSKNGVFFYNQDVNSVKKAIREFLEYDLNKGWDRV